MHQGWAPDPVMQCNSIKKQGTALSHDTRVKVRILHQPNFGVEPVDPFNAFAAHHAGAANQYWRSEQHATRKRETRAEAFAGRCDPRGSREVAPLMLQLRVRADAKWYDPAKHDAHARVGSEGSFDRRVVSFGNDIIVVKEM